MFALSRGYFSPVTKDQFARQEAKDRRNSAPKSLAQADGQAPSLQHHRRAKARQDRAA